MLISQEYKHEQRNLHKTRDDYGVASLKYTGLVTQICNKLEVKHLLDYGAGKQRLFKGLKVNHEMTLQAYDPGIEALAEEPVQAEMVTCIDVLEHIEPDYLENVLDHIEKLTEKVGFFTIHCGPAVKMLSDGRFLLCFKKRLPHLCAVRARFKIRSAWEVTIF